MSDLLVTPRLQTLPALAITDEAALVKTELLSKSKRVSEVQSIQSRDSTITVAAAIKAQLKMVEAARTEAKKPFLKVSLDIDMLAKDYRVALESELTRLNLLIGGFEEQRTARVIDEEETIEQEQVRLAHEAIKDAPEDATAEERGMALERAADAESRLEAATNQIATIRSKAEAIKPSGGALRKDWDITVKDVKELYAKHPQCVELTPRMMAIKDLLKIGIIPAGVTAHPKTSYATRAAK